MSKCPYPKYIIDGVSETQVDNPLYLAWHKGYIEGYKEGQLAALKEEKK